MADITIFIVGSFVTLLLCGTVGMLLWASRVDGEIEEAYRDRKTPPSATKSTG